MPCLNFAYSVSLVYEDAYPVKRMDKLIEPDIVNPHYREAEGQIGEADVSPTPLLFPTPTRGVVFRFFTAPRAEADGKPKCST